MGGVTEDWSSLMTRPSRDQESTCAEVLIVQGLFPCSCYVLLEKEKSAPDPFRTLGLWTRSRSSEGRGRKIPWIPAELIYSKEITEKYSTCKSLVKKMKENHRTCQRQRQAALQKLYHRRQKEILNLPKKV